METMYSQQRSQLWLAETCVWMLVTLNPYTPSCTSSRQGLTTSIDLHGLIGRNLNPFHHWGSNLGKQHSRIDSTDRCQITEKDSRALRETSRTYTHIHPCTHIHGEEVWQKWQKSPQSDYLVKEYRSRIVKSSIKTQVTQSPGNTHEPWL